MPKFVNQLYLDVDGVHANFDKSAATLLQMDPREFEKEHGSDEFWRHLREADDFFFNLELMEDAMVLFDAVKHLEPVFLTGAPSQMPFAHEQKKRWIAKHFGDTPVIVCQSKNKYQYCLPGDVIVDDWPKHKDKWESVGGVWVHHDNAVSSLEKLKSIGVL